MKNILKLTTLAVFFLLANCDDDDTNSKSQELRQLTATPWSHAVVNHATDGDLSDQYETFAISFSKNIENGYDGTFIISNGGYAFPENTGKWKLDDAVDQIIFDSGRWIQYDVTENTLHLEFSIDAPGGRSNGLSGHFEFDLKPL
jgi:hypothetical protein